VTQGFPGRLRLRIFLRFRHYNGGRSSAKRTGRLYPRRNPWYSLSEAVSTSGHMVLSGVPRKKFLVTSPGTDPGNSRLIVQRLNLYTIPGPEWYIKHKINRCVGLVKTILLNILYSRKYVFIYPENLS